ncbi:unnamed protein product [Discosporangium mesarthrocarpum]
MSEITVNVRCSNGEKFSSQVDPAKTVLEFKQSIAEKAAVTPELQRLIFKGRVMKDEQTLASYTVEADSTVHLVRSRQSATPAPPASGTPAASTPSTTPATPFGTFPGVNTGQGGAPGGAANNPFAAMMGAGGVPDVNRMQQQLLSNPDMMANIMNSPMMESMLNNPEMMRNLMFSNPHMRQVMQNNPQLAHVLNDPNVMRQTLDMMRNPEAMRQAMRSQDLAMRHIENHPEGFNALRRMYQACAEPMMQATQNMMNPGTGGDQGSSSSSGGSTTPSSTSTGPNTSALPNPWAASGTGVGPTGTAAPGGAPTAGGGGGAQNPWANFGGGDGGMGMGGVDPAAMSQMMNNPMVQQMVEHMSRDPAMLEGMIQNNPTLRQAVEANPGMRDQLPTLMRQMADPQNMQAILNMQSAMQQLQRSGLIPPGAGGVVPGGGMAGLGNFANLNLGAGTPPAPTGGLDFTSILGGGGAPHGSSATPPTAARPTPASPAAPTANPEETYAAQITQMGEMGFTDRQACIRALVATGGNVNAAVERMLGGGV